MFNCIDAVCSQIIVETILVKDSDNARNFTATFGF